MTFMAFQMIGGGKKNNIAKICFEGFLIVNAVLWKVFICSMYRMGGKTATHSRSFLFSSTFLTRSWENRSPLLLSHTSLMVVGHIFKERRKVRADLWEPVVRLHLQDCTLQQIHDVQHASNVDVCMFPL